MSENQQMLSEDITFIFIIIFCNKAMGIGHVNICVDLIIHNYIECYLKRCFGEYIQKYLDMILNFYLNIFKMVPDDQLYYCTILGIFF
jgi:hypothetical protein